MSRQAGGRPNGQMVQSQSKTAMRVLATNNGNDENVHDSKDFSSDPSMKEVFSNGND